MQQPKVNIADSSGNLVGVTDNKLDVNLGTAASIDIGDVEIKGHASLDEGNNATISNSSATQLTASSTPCKHVDVMAAIANTGIIYIGGAGVTTATGIALYAGDVYSLNIDPFLMSVAVGASCAFLTPIGHQCNALILGPGGYKFSDYWRMGLPLEILIVLFGTPLILYFWPL